MIFMFKIFISDSKFASFYEMSGLNFDKIIISKFSLYERIFIFTCIYFLSRTSAFFLKCLFVNDWNLFKISHLLLFSMR